jgi:hypothetical protein
VDALETLVGIMRAGPLPPLSDAAEIRFEEGREEDLVVESIRRSWAAHFATERRPPTDDLIGVVRTILGSIRKVKAPGPRSQSYMHHIAGFLTKKLGVSVRAFSADHKPLPDPEDGELVRLGRRWLAGGDPAARTGFRELVTHLLATGQAGQVLDDCHRVLGEVSDPSSPVAPELTAVIRKARESLRTSMG